MAKLVSPTPNIHLAPKKELLGEKSAVVKVLRFRGKAKSGKELIDDLYNTLENNRDEFINLQKETDTRIWKFKVKNDKKGIPSLLVYLDPKSKDKHGLKTIARWFEETLGDNFNNILFDIRSLAKKCCQKKCHGCNEGNPDRKL